jgi:hypothetical protein
MQLGHCQYHDDTQFNNWQQQQIIPFSEMSRMGLTPTQMSIQWVPVLAPGNIIQGMNLITYLT